MVADKRPAGDDSGRTDKRVALGWEGERLAEQLLTARGARVLARNWRCREAELDHVVLDSSGRVRFVEVKTRTGSGFGSPAEAVTEEKLRRLRVAARHWLAANPGGWRQVCFDVVGVDLSDAGYPRLELLEDVI